MSLIDIMYLVLWAALAVYMFVSAHKVSPVLYVAGGFFVFMFAWYIIDDIISADLKNGTYGIIFKIAAGVFLAIFVILYFINKKKPKA